jgi:hydroxyacylglutathione hydrolase
MVEMEKYIFNYGEEVTVCMFPCLRDNYGFLVHNHNTNTTACIDTPDSKRIIEAAKELNWSIDMILNTHHHADHAGGNLEVKDFFDCKVFGFHSDVNRIPGIDCQVGHHETFLFGDIPVRVMHTPGHTLGHIVYLFEQHKIAFVGDTLFSLGCGKVFEGTYEQMWNSLVAIRNLDQDFMLYCGHEYTELNAKFALHIDPENIELSRRASEVIALRKRGMPTIPIKLSDEKKANPFLGLNFSQIAENIGENSSDPVKIFAQIRQLKDTF